MKWSLLTLALLTSAILATMVLARQPFPFLIKKDGVSEMPAAHSTAQSQFSAAGYDLKPLSEQRINELAQRLTDEESKVLLRKGTEPAFCGTLLDNKLVGVYHCRLCSLPLFDSNAKFNSGTGWPSFFQPFDRRHVAYHEDNAYGMKRVEIVCARCDGHLGHVFDDGPKPTGLRYCLNSASLEFFEAGQDLPPMARPSIQTATAFFAGGCFWGVEDRFQQVPGVLDAESGYMGGSVLNPKYKEVCMGGTGHAEVVKVVYDPAKVTYDELLARFFQFHNPTQLNRQGPDVGTQYRSAIFPADESQRQAALAFIAEQSATERFRQRPIVTVVETPGHQYWPAEEYHQDYHAKHGGSCAIPESSDAG